MRLDRHIANSAITIRQFQDSLGFQWPANGVRSPGGTVRYVLMPGNGSASLTDEVLRSSSFHSMSRPIWLCPRDSVMLRNGNSHSLAPPSEMSPATNYAVGFRRRKGNTTERFQIWLILPSEDKMRDPSFTMQWSEEIPRLELIDHEGRRGELTVIAGAIDGAQPLAAPPDSYASRPDSDLAIWHLVLEPLAQWVVPPAVSSDTTRTLYVFEGSVSVAQRPVAQSTGVVVRPDEPVTVTAGSAGAEVLVLQGRPIAEPVAQYGPFVMNDRAGIEQALLDYQTTGFGGWPCPTDDPVQARDVGRFARHADGTLERRTELDHKQPA